MVAPAAESRAAPPDPAPSADAPGAWIRRGETEMSATPRAPGGGPVMAVGSSWLVKQLSPGTARPAAPAREPSPSPPPPPPPPPPAPTIPSSPPRVTLPPAPDIPVPSTRPSAPASEPVATCRSERKFKAPGPKTTQRRRSRRRWRGPPHSAASGSSSPLPNLLPRRSPRRFPRRRFLHPRIQRGRRGRRPRATGRPIPRTRPFAVLAEVGTGAT